MLGTLWRDLRYGARTLIKQPFFTLVAVGTLAMGIGANSAIFSIINSVLLRPLAIKNPDQVVNLWETKAGGFRGSVSVPNLRDWREQNDVFLKIAVYQLINVSLQGKESPERLRAAAVTPEFFTVMGVEPELGRPIAEGEDQDGRHRVAVLSHRLWETNFGSDRNIIGRQIELGGENTTIIGVMPASFRFPGRAVDLWKPLVFTPAQIAERGSHAFLSVGRLKDGVTLSRAQETMSAIGNRLAQQYPDQQAGRSIGLFRLQDEMVRNARPALLALMAAVGLVLLIACTNVANLLLARATSRRREMAIRAALGAGRVRILRQLLTESVLLSLLGGALGLILAYFGLDLLLKLAAGILPRAAEVALDGQVMAFTLIVSVLTGVLFGVAPAWQTSKIDLQSALKEGGATTGGPQTGSLRGLFVMGEVAAALILLIGACLLIKSFARLQQTETGLQPENVLTAGVTLPDAKYPIPQSANQFQQQLLDRVSALPGVQAAGIINLLPLQNWGYNGGVEVEGQPPPPPGQELYIEYRAVSPNYFRALGVPLIAGRFVDERDLETSTKVVLVNQTFVSTLIPNQNPLGKIVKQDGERYEIVGVVGDVKQSGLTQPARPELYWHYAQVPFNDMRKGVTLVVRAAAAPAALTSAIRNSVLSIDPNQPIHNVKTMEEVIAESISDRRLNMLLLGIFAAVAVALASIGVYSVMSYLVAQHTREFGIRIALGAQARDIMKLILRQGLSLTAIGIIVGLAGAFALTRLMENLLYGVKAADLAIYLAAPLALIVIALLACCVPAFRAMKVDPIIALRSE